MSDSASLEAKWREAQELLEPRLQQLANEFERSGVRELVEYMTRGGKMIRGFITILFSEALGGSAEDAVDAAAAVELVQAASLALDDIVDRDVERRGQPAAWVIYGVGKAAMVSLLLVPRALKLVEQYGPVALGYSIEAWELMVRGEILDAYSSLNLAPRDYVNLITLKTSTLFSLAATLGALAAKRPEYADLAWNYGDEFGKAYQIADDLADYINFVRGLKPKLDPSEKLFLEWASGSTNGADIGLIMDKAYEHLKLRIERSSQLAVSLAPGRARGMLALLPSFAVNKMLESAGLSLKAFELRRSEAGGRDQEPA